MKIPGVEAQEVLALIRERGGATPDAGAPGRRDRKLGLIVEGGGMRGVYSGGCLLGLDFLNLRDVFDEVYATSSGSINAAYFLSGQGAEGITVYFRDINTSRFINPWRLHKIIDVDYAFDQVISKLRPLDTQAVLAARPRFFVAVTDHDKARGRLVDVGCSATPLVQVLKASSALPIVYNKTIEVDGVPCIDGGFSLLLPIREAVAGGCTDLLILLTRPGGYRHEAPSRGQRWLFNRLCARGNRRMEELFSGLHTLNNGLRDLALGRDRLEEPVNIATICPEDGDLAVSRLTKETEKLQGAAERMGVKTVNLLGGDPGAFGEFFRTLC